MPPDIGYLNQTLADTLNAINVQWQPCILIFGVRILWTIALVAFGVNALTAIFKRDAGGLLDGLAYTCLSIGILDVIFENAIPWLTAVQQTFQQIGATITGQSPATLTPTGIFTQGWVLADQLWAAASLAGWFLRPLSHIESLIAGLIVLTAFVCAAIILLLVEVELAAIIVGGTLLLAFAALPWTLPILQRWALTGLSLSMKLFGLLAVIGIGLIEATGWSHALAATAPTLTSNLGQMFLPAFESLLFGALVIYVPNALAGLVAGGQGATMGLGESLLGSAGEIAAEAAGEAGARIGKASYKAAGAGAAKAMSAAQNVAQTVRSMLLAP